MNTYVIRREKAWASPEELEATAERSKQVAEDDFPDDIAWIRSYVIKEDGGTLGTVCIYQATDIDGRSQSRPARRHAGGRGARSRGHGDHPTRSGAGSGELEPVLDPRIGRGARRRSPLSRCARPPGSRGSSPSTSGRCRCSPAGRPASPISARLRSEPAEGEDVDRLRDRIADGLDVVDADRRARRGHRRLPPRRPAAGRSCRRDRGCPAGSSRRAR